MRRFLFTLGATLIAMFLPVSGLAQDASPIPASPVATLCAEPAATPGTSTPPATPVNQTALDALQQIPLDKPGIVSREAHAETGELTLALPAPLSAVKIRATVVSGDAGQIGRVARDDDKLVFVFDEITYDVSPIDLPNGDRIDAQTIRLDPDQPSTLCVDLATGQITRNFHWLLTGTNVQYDGSPTLGLGDHGKATVADVTQIDPEHFTIHLLTHWQSEFKLDTWGIGDTTLPSGTITASAEFDGIYQLDYS